MNKATKIGRQQPTISYVLPYKESRGADAVDLYLKTGKQVFEWQELLLYDILGIDDEGLWAHERFGLSVPRQNGKNEVLAMRELYGLSIGERILHTAHKTTTSGNAFRRLCKLIEAIGIPEKKGKVTKGYRSGKSKGQEFIELDECFGGGRIDFRTRTTTGGLGETFDLLIIDEAQEYKTDQHDALQYTITTSSNPQIIMTGTPPTPLSSGTVFLDFRKTILSGFGKHAGWAEWSVEKETDPNNVDAWYETNPSMGLLIRERTVENEIGNFNEIDFNIQRLGLWIKYNQKSAISKLDWDKCLITTLPKFDGLMNIGIKYGKESESVSMAIALKTVDGDIFTEAIDCRPGRDGNKWLVDFISKARNGINRIVVDGASGQQLLEEELRNAKIKNIVLPTVKQVIAANAIFEQKLFSQKIKHMDQPSLTKVVTNCEKRAIGSQGGFGYSSLKADADITLMDAVIYAAWACEEFGTVKKKQRIMY